MTNVNRIALIAALFAPVIALGQSLKDQIVGTWRTVAIYNEQDGKKTHLYTDKPIGISMYDKSGNYVAYLARPDLPKFASGVGDAHAQDRGRRDDRHQPVRIFRRHLVHEGHTDEVTPPRPVKPADAETMRAIKDPAEIKQFMRRWVEYLA